MKKKLDLLLFKEDDWWVAQCLNYDIAAQARTIRDVQYEIQRIIVGRIVMAEQFSVDPFEDLSPAPEVYFKMAKDRVGEGKYNGILRNLTHWLTKFYSTNHN